jgi:tRNA A37 N6-isopentenylltransferase MiaA
MLAGRLPQPELRDAIERATRQYAKRQETWFRHQLRDAGGGMRDGSVWVLDASESAAEVAAKIVERWRAVAHPTSLIPHPGS